MKQFDMDIIEAIEKRRSVRTFNGIPLSDDIREELLSIIDSSRDPFGGSVTIRLRRFDTKGESRPGTFG